MKKEKPAREKVDLYTATEVGSLFDSLLKEIKVIGEGHSGLDKRLGDLEVEVHGNSERLQMLQLVSGVTKDKVSHLDNRVSLLDKKISHLDEKVSQLDQKVDKLGEELKGEIRELGTRLTAVETRR